ncbi:MAG TPA: hypothetical protein VHX37_04140 [Acidobacteriaceae bacterium]|jgi:hypothetical protein|nr:hypothetical protein [Acidobacteriaceae bacterium]
MQRKNLSWVVALSLLAGLSAGAQTTPGQPTQTPPPASAPPQAPSTAPQPQKPPTRITPEQAKELFASVGQILQFASDDSKLPIQHQVKSKLITRAEVEKYLVSKMNDDKDAKRMERSEIVLKKFGLIDSDFQLRPFLVKLLDEQIAAYYDSKSKTVNLLDWIEPDQQKPVLAHELTHALQDQRINLDKWQNQTSDDISHSYTEDRKHVASDEEDTARDAVLEGQAMAVFVDYSLAPIHRTIHNSPQMVERLMDTMLDSGNSKDDPVLSRAPLLLQESLLFPYKDGLKFEATLIEDSRNADGAFAGVLDRPPDTSYEIMNPHAYEQQVKVPVLNVPDIHPVIDAQYSPYDIGVMGELDVRILSELFGGPQAAAELTPAWDGGLYYAAQKKDAADKDSTSSVALLYLSQWKSPEAAADFVKMYAGEIGRKYISAHRDTAAETSSDEQIYNTSEGPVLIVTSGNDVFVSESFDLTTARKLQLLMLGAQQTSQSDVASRNSVPQFDLAGNMVHFMADCGMMKFALVH